MGIKARLCYEISVDERAQRHAQYYNLTTIVILRKVTIHGVIVLTGRTEHC